MKIPKNLLNSKNFLIGFEVECVLSEDIIDYKDIEENLLKIHPLIELGDDGSIDCEGKLIYEFNAEIKTPPLPPTQSFGVLKRVFQLVNKYGYTNNSCGFHVNISPTSKKVYNSINPFKFTLSDLWRQIKMDFGRLNNEYCSPVWGEHKIKPIKAFLKIARNKFDIFHWKDADVNFQHYDNWNKKVRRVEIRAFGGKDYHKKLSLIKKYANRIMKTFLQCCEC